MSSEPQRKLTPKQQRFVEEYITDLNATQAAIRAGYSAKTAGTFGYQLLQKKLIETAISTHRAKVSERSVVTQERIIAEMAKIGFSDVRRMFDEDGRLRQANEWDDDTAGAVAGVETSTFTRGRGDDAAEETIRKVKLWDKPTALVKLGQHLGMFEQRIKLDGVEDLLAALGEAARRVANRKDEGEESAVMRQLEGGNGRG